MKKIKQKITGAAFLLVALAVVAISCKDDETETLALSRQFTPAEFEITSGETFVTVAWDAALFTVPGDVQYTIELSKSPDFANIEKTATTSDRSLTFLDTDLDIRVDYFARVKAVGKGGAADSNWLISAPFRITGEIFILPINEYDVLVDAAKIAWQPGKDISTIVFTPTSGAPVEVSVSEAEAAAGTKTVDGLDDQTTYTAEIFSSDGVSKGSVTFTTKPSYGDSNVVDLRSISTVARPNVLADTLGTIPSGSVVLLKRGETYTIPAAEFIDRSVTIVSGADMIPDLAKVFLSANFNLTASSAIDSIVFKDLYLYTDNYDSKYVFNINQVGTIGKVRFENVRGHKFRGFFRIQTGAAGAQVGSFLMNNCVIDSLRDFSLVNTNNSNTVANIKVTNSTIYNARKVIDHRSPGSNSIVFENCTFNNLPTGGAAGAGAFWFIDLGTGQNSANPIEIRNCIFGKTRDEGMGGNDANGIRTAGATPVNTTNSYRTSDFVSSVEAFQIPGLLQYSGASTSLFAAPDAGNFTIKDAAFPGKTSAGDPRWR